MSPDHPSQGHPSLHPSFPRSRARPQSPMGPQAAIPTAGCSNPPRRSCHSFWWAPAPSPCSAEGREMSALAGTPHPPHPSPKTWMGLTLGATLNPPKPGTEDTKRGSSLLQPPPQPGDGCPGNGSPGCAPRPHLDSPYLEARRGLVERPGDFGAELHHGDGCCRQGDLPRHRQHPR